MSKVNFTPEKREALEEWIASCPREFANVVFVSTAQMKDNDGNFNYLGKLSIMETNRNDALEIISEMIRNLAEHHHELSKPTR
jgi:hypothetical protein